MSPASDQLEPGDVIASRHVVESLWRVHPLGDLYHCHDAALDRLVVLHRLDRAFADPGVGDRLFETRGRATLGSPLIPDVLDYGTDLDGRPFVVTPACEGSSLAEWFSRRDSSLPFERALELIASLAEALEPAHADRLVHGGIEPESVIVERGPDGLRVVALLGFGLVPALPLRMTATHVAPELVHGAATSPAADVYALGILMWSLIHGEPPFRGPTVRVLDAQLNQALPDLPVPADVPPAFVWVLRRMLAKHPLDRFADATELVEQLREFMPAVPDLTDELEPDDDTDEYGRVDPRGIVVCSVSEPLSLAERTFDGLIAEDEDEEPVPESLPMAKRLALLTLAISLLLLAIAI